MKDKEKAKTPSVVRREIVKYLEDVAEMYKNDEKVSHVLRVCADDVRKGRYHE